MSLLDENAGVLTATPDDPPCMYKKVDFNTNIMNNPFVGATDTFMFKNSWYPYGSYVKVYLQ
jgi:hypothetical protein